MEYKININAILLSRIFFYSSIKITLFKSIYFLFFYLGLTRLLSVVTISSVSLFICALDGDNDDDECSGVGFDLYLGLTRLLFVVTISSVSPIKKIIRYLNFNSRNTHENFHKFATITKSVFSPVIFP